MKFDAKGLKRLFLGHCEGPKAYQSNLLENEENYQEFGCGVFRKQNAFRRLSKWKSRETTGGQDRHISQIERGRVGCNGDVSEPDEEPNMEDQTEAKVPATKSAHSAEATKLNHGKRRVIKPPPPHQYGNETMSNFRFPDRPRIPLG